MKQSIVLGLIILLLVLPACSEAENAKDQFCQKLEKAEDPLDSLVEIDAESKIEDIESDVEKVDKALSALDSTGIDLNLGALDAVEEAFASVEAKVQGAKDLGALGDTADDIQQAAVRLQQAYDAVNQQVCGSGD